MVIQVRCTCGKTFLARDGLIGKRTKCPNCKTRVVVPDPRKQFATDVVDDQMRRNADETQQGPWSTVVVQVGKDLDELGLQINQIRDDLAEVRRRMNTA